MTQRPQICLVTDSGLLVPTAFALWSLLRHLSRPADLHFWGDQLRDDEWRLIERIALTHPESRLHMRPIDPQDLAGAEAPAPHISAATMGRLFIPRHIAGRVLYLDGDTMVTGDIAPLFDMDLPTPLAGVRDYVTLKWTLNRAQAKPDHLQRLGRIENHLPSASYINSGVLLLDCDRIRAEPKVMRRMEDVLAASATEWGDQDHLNFVFAGQVTLLNPAYNASWRRAGRQRHWAATLGGTAEECRSIPDVILHFHGPKKPWKKPRHDLWSQRARAVLAYRNRMRAFLREFPAVTF